MRWCALFISTLISACVHKQGAPPATECFGEPGAKRFVVYLHGMDVREKSTQEIDNRAKILRIADQIGARVAIPRAAISCLGNPHQICWGWKFDSAELEGIRQQIETAAATCGAPPAFELIGFSNGGYAVNKLFEKCMMKPGQNFISIGAGNRPHKINATKLENCGQLTLIVGRLDQYNNMGMQRYTEDLKSFGGSVQLAEHAGHHNIPENVLLKVLTSK